MSLHNKTLVILLVATLLLTSCAASPVEQPSLNPTDDKSAPEPSKTAISPELPEPTKIPERVETPEIEPVAGEVPDEVLDEIIADLMKSTGANREEIQVVRAEAVVWNDGSLGCPKPGEFYIQMMINGYWVVFEAEGIEYDYRVSDKGSFKLCEGENMSPINPPDTGEYTNNPLVSQAKADLSERLGIPTIEIELLSFELVVWPDASLGCPQPGMRYIQVPHDGALIRLSAGGQVYDYHSGGNRGLFLCEKSTQGTKSAPKIDLIPPPGSADE